MTSTVTMMLKTAATQRVVFPGDCELLGGILTAGSSSTSYLITSVVVSPYIHIIGGLKNGS